MAGIMPLGDGKIRASLGSRVNSRLSDTSIRVVEGAVVIPDQDQVASEAEKLCSSAKRLGRR